MSAGDLTVEELRTACLNIGYDITCGRCVSIFYTSSGSYAHDPTCRTSSTMLFVLSMSHALLPLVKIADAYDDGGLDEISWIQGQTRSAARQEKLNLMVAELAKLACPSSESKK